MGLFDLKLDAKQFARFDVLLNTLADRCSPLQDIAVKLGEINDTLNAGFTQVAEAIANIQPPKPTQRGVIMATFRIADDTPDFAIVLVGSGFADAEGNPTGAADIDLSVESSNPAAIEAVMGAQSLSDDGLSVTASVAVHVGAPASDVATLTYRAVNRDTNALVAAGTDDFIVEVGEAAVGVISSSVPLTPEP